MKKLNHEEGKYRKFPTTTREELYEEAVQELEDLYDEWGAVNPNRELELSDKLEALEIIYIADLVMDAAESKSWEKVLFVAELMELYGHLYTEDVAEYIRTVKSECEYATLSSIIFEDGAASYLENIAKSIIRKRRKT